MPSDEINGWIHDWQRVGEGTEIKPLYRFVDEKNGMESFVIPHSRGGFAAILRDTDANENVPGGIIIYTKDTTPDRAKAKAKEMIGTDGREVKASEGGPTKTAAEVIKQQTIRISQSDNDDYFNQKLPTWRNGYTRITRDISQIPDPDGIYEWYGTLKTPKGLVTVTSIDGKEWRIHGPASKTAAVLAPERLSLLLAMLRALHQLHWATHWQSEGPNSYMDHLLFERLYNGITEEIDGLAEKLVGNEGGKIVDPMAQMILVAQITERWVHIWETDTSPDCLVHRAMQAENEVMTLLIQILSAGNLPPGLANFIQGVADKHETHAYLLTQRLQADGVSRVASRHLARSR